MESPGFFLEYSRIWKVLENHFGPGESWKKCLKIIHFSTVSNGKQAAVA